MRSTTWDATKAREMWMDDSVTMKEIAETVGASYNALYAHAIRHGWPQRKKGPKQKQKRKAPAPMTVTKGGRRGRKRGDCCLCPEPATRTVADFRVCSTHGDRIIAIASDAGISIDERRAVA